MKSGLVKITALSAAIPKRIIKNLEYTEHFPKEDVAEIVEKIGIYERRFTDKETCSSDLCFAAAQKLIEDNNINKEEIDLLIFKYPYSIKLINYFNIFFQ